LEEEDELQPPNLTEEEAMEMAIANSEPTSSLSGVASPSNCGPPRCPKGGHRPLWWLLPHQHRLPPHQHHFRRPSSLCIGRGFGRFKSISPSSSTMTSRQPWRAPLLSRAFFLSFILIFGTIEMIILKNKIGQKNVSGRWVPPTQIDTSAKEANHGCRRSVLIRCRYSLLPPSQRLRLIFFWKI
jgi:hypothetical protein